MERFQSHNWEKHTNSFINARATLFMQTGNVNSQMQAIWFTQPQSHLDLMSESESCCCAAEDWGGGANRLVAAKCACLRLPR